VAAQIAIDRERAMTIMLSHIVGPSIITQQCSWWWPSAQVPRAALHC